MELNIEGGTFNGNLVVDSSITDASSIINVTGTPSFTGTGWDSYIKIRELFAIMLLVMAESDL